eukprot:COSAG06_NODE_2628_length_6556_cov_4.840948_6_plen_111_part_00
MLTSQGFFLKASRAPSVSCSRLDDWVVCVNNVGIGQVQASGGASSNWYSSATVDVLLSWRRRKVVSSSEKQGEMNSDVSDGGASMSASDPVSLIRLFTYELPVPKPHRQP